jgi:hypothetical protein
LHTERVKSNIMSELAKYKIRASANISDHDLSKSIGIYKYYHLIIIVKESDENESAFMLDNTMFGALDIEQN